MKPELEIQKAHDMLISILLGDCPMPLDERSKRDLNVAAGVLCWLLEHTHNPTFAKNLSMIEAWMQEHGVIIEKKKT